MSRPSVGLCVMGVLAAMGLVAAQAMAAATTESVLAKLTANAGAIKAFEADVKTIAKTAGGGMEMTGHMAIQGVVKDGKRVGSLMNFKQAMKMGEMEMTSLMVNDGEFMWMESKNPMGLTVMKMKIDPAKQQTGDTSALIDQYDLKLVGEEEFDGQTMWILEGTPKAKADASGAGRRRDPRRASRSPPRSASTSARRTS